MKKSLSFSCLLIILVILNQSCKKYSSDENTIVPVGQIEIIFSISQLKATSNIAFDSCYKQGIIAAVITIQNSKGETVINSQKVDIYNFNTFYISKIMSLPSGNYNLTKFLVLNAKDSIVYASPLEGSKKANLVTIPLPISFNIQTNKTQKISLSVVSTADCQPENFGYTSLEFNIAKTFDFLIGVFIYNDTSQNYKLTSAGIKIFNNTDTVYSGKLAIIANFINKNLIYDSLGITNKITLSENYNSFTLEILKDGYEKYSHTFTKEELRLYFRNEDRGPLVVILNKNQQQIKGLVAYYKFDGDVLDYSGNNNHGILYGASLTADRYGNAQSAYEFNTSYIKVPGFGNVIPTKEISISLWAKTLYLVSNFALMLTPDDNNRFGISINYYHNGTNSIFWDFGWDHSGGNVPGRLYDYSVLFDTNWHHYTFISSVDSNFMKIYKDGVLICSKTDAASINSVANKDLRIGSAENANYFTGMLDEIRIYNRVLAENEISELANH